MTNEPTPENLQPEPEGNVASSAPTAGNASTAPSLVGLTAVPLGQPQIFRLPPGVAAPGIPLNILGSAAGFQAQVEMQVWQGQFPPPEAIERYENVHPGTFDRLISMAEKTQDAQIDAQKDARADVRDMSRRGQYLGAIVTVLAVAGALVCAWLKQPLVAVAFLGVPLLSVAKALVDSAKAQPTSIAVTPSLQPQGVPPPTSPDSSEQPATP